jgi:predicted ester cyclase
MLFSKIPDFQFTITFLIAFGLALTTFIFTFLCDEYCPYGKDVRKTSNYYLSTYHCIISVTT